MPEKPKIKRGKDQYGQGGNAYAVIDLYRSRRVSVDEPVDDVIETIMARVDHGRWLVECDYCKSAQLVGDEDLRFFCINCSNISNDGKWREIVWPENAEEIENVLAVRPIDNRHWSPGETIDELKAENVAHDLPEIWEET